MLFHQAWPLDACRGMGMRLMNMRDRRKDKCVSMCAEVEEKELIQLKEFAHLRKQAERQGKIPTLSLGQKKKEEEEQE